MRILICTNSYPPRFVGGAELVAHHLAVAMAAQGHEVVAFVGDPDEIADQRIPTRATYDGIQVYRLALRRADYDPGRLNYIDHEVDAHFEALCAEFSPEVVHCHNLTGLSTNLPEIAFRSGARVFMTLHDFWGFCPRNTLTISDHSPCRDRKACDSCVPKLDEARPPIEVRRQQLANMADHVERFMAPSRFVFDRYVEAGWPVARMCVVPNGVDTAQFEAILPPPRRSYTADAPLRMVFVGYFGAHKGVQLLPEVVARMRNRDRVVLDLVGEGPLASHLRTEILRLNLDGLIRFRGKFEPGAMAKVYAEADVVVVPSTWPENQPVCIMEAKASARAVVASNIGGIPDIVRNGEDGILVRSGDVKAFADAIDYLADHPNACAELGENGRRGVSGLTYLAQSRTIIDLFKSTPSNDRHQNHTSRV